MSSIKYEEIPNTSKKKVPIMRFLILKGDPGHNAPQIQLFGGDRRFRMPNYSQTFAIIHDKTSFRSTYV